MRKPVDDAGTERARRLEGELAAALGEEEQSRRFARHLADRALEQIARRHRVPLDVLGIDRGGELFGDRRQPLCIHLLVGAAVVSVRELERADHFAVLAERHDDHVTRGETRRAIHGIAKTGIVADAVHDDGLVVPCRPARDALRDGNAKTEEAVLLERLRRGEDELVALLVEQEERDRLGAREALDAREHDPEHLGELEGRGQRMKELVDDRELSQPLGSLLLGGSPRHSDPGG